MATSSQPATTPASVEPLICPDWCTLPVGHDSAEPNRIHYAPTAESMFLCFGEAPMRNDLDRAWYAEIIGLELLNDTAAGMAEELRAAAADIIAAAEWLEARS